MGTPAAATTPENSLKWISFNGWEDKCSHFIFEFLLFQKIANKFSVLYSRFGMYVLDITNLTHSVTLICLFVSVICSNSSSVNHSCLFVCEIRVIFFKETAQVVFLRKPKTFKLLFRRVCLYCKYLNPWSTSHLDAGVSLWSFQTDSASTAYIWLFLNSQNPRGLAVGTQK